ncbi:MAG TPA: cation:proton antiporter [Patescibacteria group bacterium]|nr:cation:proton antiporter [Patescibacteria group bacterium]
MDHTAGPILEIGLLLLGAVVAGWAARRVGLPAVVGYLALGIVVSPFTPGVVADREQLQLLADLGVVLLLFEVGIEVDLLRIRNEQRGLIAAAPIQAVVTTVISGIALYLVGLEPIPAALIGLSIALSSSVVIVNITKSRRRTTDRQTEQALLGWSALQDSTGVAIAAVLLALLGSGGRPLGEAAIGLVAFLVLTIGTARLLPVVRRALRAEHDLFLIVSVATGLALAGIGSALFGVPLALAAFVGGLAVSESPEAAEARRRLLPFRDLFAVLFFVAIGTLIQPDALIRGLGWLGLFLVLIVVSKVLVVYVLARAAGLPARPLQLAIGLGQVGEFSFVLGSAAVAAGAISNETYVALVAAVAVSIAVSTVVVRLAGSRPYDHNAPANATTLTEPAVT